MSAEAGRDGALPDARPDSLVLRLTPDFALPYVQLARLDRPAGWQLLLAPCWWSAALAGDAVHRGAGCTYNDILDRDLDAGVARTRGRPLPSGRVSPRAAALFLAAQALVGLAALVAFNRFSIGLGLASLIVVAIYPLTKRVTSWPQAALGLAFSWGALMGWSARFGALGAPALLLYAAAFYLLTALLAQAALLAAGGGWIAEFGWAAFAAHLVWQLSKVEGASEKTALMLFRANRDAGLLLFLGFAVEGWTRAALG